MGKGTIISGGTDGQYQVQLKMNRAAIDAKISVLTTRQTTLQTEIDALDAYILTLDPVVDAALIAQTNSQIGILELKKVSCAKQISYLNTYAPTDPTVSAWCADFTEDLSGSVGTIEIPGERGNVIIQPGFDSNAVYNSTRDGQLTQYPGCTPSNLFYNLALLPGWQKWKPLHRFGTITSIDYGADTCNVNLDAVTSSQQSLDINQSTTLSGVTIDYMNCNSAAFEIGDDVLIEFTSQSWASPKVIGFKDNPKPCGFFFKLTRDDDELVDDTMGCSFAVYNSLSSPISGITTSYDSETEMWQVIIDDSADYDENGHWVEYTAQEYSIPTQYPYKYKIADKKDAADLLLYGEYEDNVPYWEVDDQGILPNGHATGLPLIISMGGSPPSSPIPLFGPGDDFLDHQAYYNPIFDGFYYDCISFDEVGAEYKKQVNIKASIPYQVTYAVTSSGTFKADVRGNYDIFTPHGGGYGVVYTGTIGKIITDKDSNYQTLTGNQTITPDSQDEVENSPDFETGINHFIAISPSWVCITDSQIMWIYADTLQDLVYEYDY